MVNFAFGWAPLERRWEASDFSVMQLQMWNPSFLMIVRFNNNDLSAAVGAEEVELQGTSSKMVSNAIIENMMESSRYMTVT